MRALRELFVELDLTQLGLGWSRLRMRALRELFAVLELQIRMLAFDLS